MGSPRRRMWGLLLLIVVAPAAYYGVQAVLPHARPATSALATTVPITAPSAEPRGPTPAVTLAPPVPAPREMDAMAFDKLHDDIVMYGGSWTGAPSRATWTFDSGGWHLQHPVASPDIVDAGWMAADPVSGSIVLIGDAARTGHPIETWTWDGATWTQRGAPPMPHQTWIGMAALPALGQLLLVTTPTSGQPASDDTWTWRGSAWHLDAPATALPIEGSTPVLVSDPAHRRVVAVFTGTANSSSQTWTWNGATWSQLRANEVAPFDPITAMAAADPRTGDVLMYIGGGDVRVGSTWALRGSTWRQVDPASPVVDSDYHGAWLLADPHAGRVVMIGNAGRPNTLNALWVFTGSGWKAASPSALAPQAG